MMQWECRKKNRIPFLKISLPKSPSLVSSNLALCQPARHPHAEVDDTSNRGRLWIWCWIFVTLTAFMLVGLFFVCLFAQGISKKWASKLRESKTWCKFMGEFLGISRKWTCMKFGLMSYFMTPGTALLKVVTWPLTVFRKLGNFAANIHISWILFAVGNSKKPPWKLTWHWKIPIFNRKYIDSFMVDLLLSCWFLGGYIKTPCPAWFVWWGISWMPPLVKRNGLDLMKMWLGFEVVLVLVMLKIYGPAGGCN